jgi:uncharacterized protein (TIGR02271 family)
MFGSKQSFVPIQGATGGDVASGIRVPFEKATVKDAPRIDPDGALSHDEERTLYEHYGRQYADYDQGSGVHTDETRTAADTTRGERGDTSGPNTDDAMTRSEEEMHVNTERQERGRARLRKYVVTEQVEKTVPVQREEVRIEREPITDANRDEALSGRDISEDEHEVVLHEERPVVDKKVVPKERVRMEKDTVREDRNVSGEVRKERIEADDAKKRR